MKPPRPGYAIIELRAEDREHKFVNDLRHMYLKYIKKRRWRPRVHLDVPVLREISNHFFIIVRGRDAYRSLRHETGVHRKFFSDIKDEHRWENVMVAVYPALKPKQYPLDLTEIDVQPLYFRHNNEWIIRAFHQPTESVAFSWYFKETAQEEMRSTALDLLRAKLYAAEHTPMNKAALVRTTHYAETTDHRTGQTLRTSDAVMLGQIQPFVDALELQS